MTSTPTANTTTDAAAADSALFVYLNLKLREIGQPGVALPGGDALAPLMEHFAGIGREKERSLARHLCPVDQRIQDFLERQLGDTGAVPRLPSTTLVLDRPGLGGLLALPPGRDRHESPILSSFRVGQGVIHNPRSDRRTTQGIFHVAEGGLPIADDKKAVPRTVFARLLKAAFTPPRDLLCTPYTAAEPAQARCLVSLHLRPVVSPGIPGRAPERSMETRVIVPGSLVANLDFVERIFGNAGDPHLPANDAALDPEHWTGHTGCIILAPHLTQFTKKELGLPPWDLADERRRRDGMCWKSEDELYNDGIPFKLTMRDTSGVIVTMISDNYFGYCKKEVKTQIGFAANLLGDSEEEHAGGAIVFPSYDLGEDFQLSRHFPVVDHTFEAALANLGPQAVPQPGGWALDKVYPDICYVPGDSFFDLRTQRISWGPAAERRGIKLLPGHTYVLPSGYKVDMVKPDENRRWRLRGTTAEGVLCHKPCTVSGGGKSEISKPISDAMFTGSVFVRDFGADFALLDEILGRDYHHRYRDKSKQRPYGRSVLSPERSLGSVVKLLSRSPDYTDEYNEWLSTIPRYVLDLVLILKRIYRPEWGDDWRKHFGVDTINGRPGNELKYHRDKLVTHYLRIGFTPDGSWRTFSLRKDFLPAVKIQAEDDITASAVVGRTGLAGLPAAGTSQAAPSLKFVHNCEFQLFQRPDDAVIRGYDHRTERDFGRPGNFFSNYEPLDRETARTVVEDTLGFDKFTDPVRQIFEHFVQAGHPDYLASPAHPRIVEGKPSKNPRYLQHRPDLEDPRTTYLALTGARLYRRLEPSVPVLFPVGAVLMGRRLNPPEPGVRPLCVYGPLHHQELPEAFMDLIASITGKSPSTTGAGSEGALTKGPFNALLTIHDLNAALVSFVLTGLPIFCSAAGWLGPRYRVDHDISLLVPEIWARMTQDERDPAFLISQGYLERCADWTHEGRPVLASRLGWRITPRFVQVFCGRVLGNPSTLFDEDMLRPEKQDPAVFAEAMENIAAAMKSAAGSFFADGSIEQAAPALRALLHIMRDGTWDGRSPDDPAFRVLFTRENLLAGDWYKSRLEAQRRRDTRFWDERVRYLENFAALENYADVAEELGIAERLGRARAAAARTRSPDYAKHLDGALGLDPSLAPPL